MRTRTAVAALAATALSLVLSSAHAQDIRFHEFTSGDEALRALELGTDCFYPLWSTVANFCSDTEFLVRKLNPDGTMAGGEFLAQGSCASGVNRGDLAILPSGEMIVAREVDPDVLAAIFDRDGNLLVGDIVVFGGSTVQGNHAPRVASHPSGKFVVLWHDDTRGEAFGRIVMSDGSMPQPEILIAQSPVGGVVRCRAAVFQTGEVLLISSIPVSLFPDIIEIQGRLFDDSLSPVGAAFVIGQSNLYDGEFPAVAVQGLDYIVTWFKGPMAVNDTDVYARRMSRSGPVGPEFRVNTYTQHVQLMPDCAMDAAGRAVIVWVSYGQDGSSVGIFGQRLDSQGNMWGPEFRVNMTTQWQQSRPQVALVPSGDFLVAFSSMTRYPGGALLLARRFFFPVSLAVAPGPAAANAPQGSIRCPDGREGWPAFSPYGTGGHGATVGTGDIGWDQLDEVLTGPGPSPVHASQVRAFEPNGSPIQKVNFYAYGTLRFGVKEGGANIDSDRYSEIVTTPGPGGVFGPHVRAWNFDATQFRPINKVNFYAFNTLRYGANGSRGNLDGDAYDELLISPGPGDIFGAQVRGFNVDGASVSAIQKINFYAFTSSFGARVAAADIESDGIGGYGDGFDEIVAGRGPAPSGDTELRIFDFDGGPVQQKWTEASVYPGYSYGLNVAGGDVDAGDTEEIVTAPGADPAAPAHILVWEWNPLLGTNPDAPNLDTIGTDDFVAFAGQTYGANVAVGTFE